MIVIYPYQFGVFCITCGIFFALAAIITIVVFNKKNK